MAVWGGTRMSARLLSLNLFCAVFVLCSGPAFAVGPLVSQASLAAQTGKATAYPQAGHVAASGVDPASASDAPEGTLVIPGHYQTIQDPLAPVNEKSFSINQNIDQRVPSIGNSVVQDSPKTSPGLHRALLRQHRRDTPVRQCSLPVKAQVGGWRACPLRDQ